MKFTGKQELTWLLFLFSLPFAMGAVYAVHNTDPHHWGYITSMAYDFAAGKRFFTETYLQYGIGQSLLFGTLLRFFSFNYTAFGILTSAVYAGTILLTYASVRVLAGAKTAVALSAAALLLHSFSIYPWPDYYAGFFLALAAYLLVAGQQERSRWRYAAAGAFLFSAFLFRNTYLLSVVFASVIYVGASAWFTSVLNRKLRVTIAVFALLVLTFLAALCLCGDLRLWFSQTIGAGPAQYGIGYKKFFSLLKKAFLLDTLVTSVFTAFLYAALLYVWRALSVPQRAGGEAEGNLFFLALLGLSGLSQATLGYEMFRLQNACSPLYLVFAAGFCGQNGGLSWEGFRTEGRLVLAMVFVSLAAKFPHASSLFKLHEKSLSSYSTVDIPYYRWHRFRKDERDYYNGLKRLICDGKSRIVNLTWDSSVPYLCPGQQNALAMPFYQYWMLASITPQKAAEVKSGFFQEGELVVTDTDTVKNPQVALKEIGRVPRPPTIRFLPTPADLSVFSVMRRK